MHKKWKIISQNTVYALFALLTLLRHCSGDATDVCKCSAALEEESGTIFSSNFPSDQTCVCLVDACLIDLDNKRIIEFRLYEDEFKLDGNSEIKVGQDNSTLLHSVTGGVDKEELVFITDVCKGWVELQTNDQLLLNNNFTFTIHYKIHNFTNFTTEDVTDSGCLMTGPAEEDCISLGGDGDNYPINTLAEIYFVMDSGYFIYFDFHYLTLDMDANDFLLLYSDSGVILSGNNSKSQGFLTERSNAQITFISNNHNATLPGFKVFYTRLGNATGNVTTTTDIPSTQIYTTTYTCLALLDIPTAAMSNADLFQEIDELYREGIAIAMVEYADIENLTLARTPRSTDVQTYPLPCDEECGKELVAHCIRQKTEVFMPTDPYGYMMSTKQLKDLTNTYLSTIQASLNEVSVTVSLEVDCNNRDWLIAFICLVLALILLLIVCKCVLDAIKLRKNKKSYLKERNLMDEPPVRDTMESHVNSQYGGVTEDESDFEEKIPYRGFFDPDSNIFVPSETGSMKMDRVFQYVPAYNDNTFTPEGTETSHTSYSSSSSNRPSTSSTETDRRSDERIFLRRESSMNETQL